MALRPNSQPNRANAQITVVGLVHFEKTPLSHRSFALTIPSRAFYRSVLGGRH